MKDEDENEGVPRYRVLVQGLAPGPFLRRYTLECRRTHQILDLVAARLTAENVARWGILAVDESGGWGDPDAPAIVGVEVLDPLQRDPDEVLLRPWGCFGSDTDARDALALARPGYVRWDEPEQVFCQANVSATDLRAALEAMLPLVPGPFRMVLEQTEDVESGLRGRLHYADHFPAGQVREFLSRHGIWALGDGFVGVGIVSLEPFHEVFVDAHGELLIWWGTDHLEDLDRYLRALGLPRHEEGELGFVSGLSHFHVEHEMTGPLDARIAELARTYNFYEHVDEEPEEGEE